MTATTPGTPTPSTRPATPSRLSTLAVLLSSIVVALPITIGRLVEAVLDNVNPANLTDVTVGLAYLREILGWSFGSLGALLVANVIVFTLIYRRARTLDALRVPLLVLGVQVVLGVGALFFAGVTPS